MVHALCNIFGRQFEALLDENEALPQMADRGMGEYSDINEKNIL